MTVGLSELYEGVPGAYKTKAILKHGCLLYGKAHYRHADNDHRDCPHYA